MDVKEQVLFLMERGLIEELCDKTPCPVRRCEDCIMGMTPNEVKLKLSAEDE